MRTRSRLIRGLVIAAAAVVVVSVGTPAVPRAEAATAAELAPAAYNRMSTAQRIGQLFMIGLTDDRLTGAIANAIQTYHFGSVLFARKTSVGAAALRKVADAVQVLTSDAATHGARFFVAANQEGGQVQALSGPGFSVIPSALAQGAMTPDALRAAAANWAAQLRSANGEPLRMLLAI